MARFVIISWDGKNKSSELVKKARFGKKKNTELLIKWLKLIKKMVSVGKEYGLSSLSRADLIEIYFTHTLPHHIALEPSLDSKAV